MSWKRPTQGQIYAGKKGQGGGEKRAPRPKAPVATPLQEGRGKGGGSGNKTNIH